MESNVGDIVKQWRKRRRFSQQKMADEVGISARHISFLETGRSIPSKDIVLSIGAFLQIPKREINRMLVVAGHAPAFQVMMPERMEFDPINFALDKLLNDHMPYPALVLNAEWDVIKANQSAVHIMSQIGFTTSDNFIECFINDNPKNSCVLNWGATVSMLIGRLRYEIDMLAGSDRLETLAKDLYSRVKEHNIPITVDYSQDTINSQLLIGNNSLSYFSLAPQMGSVLDVTASEFKVELMFPADELTRTYHTDQ